MVYHTQFDATTLHGLENFERARVKMSQAITGVLAQQPCNSTVNMIEQDW